MLAWWYGRREGTVRLRAELEALPNMRTPAQWRGFLQDSGFSNVELTAVPARRAVVPPGHSGPGSLKQTHRCEDTMNSAAELLRQGRTTEIWQKYCGFIELTLEEFMHIQQRLLLEQLELLQRLALWAGDCCATRSPPRSRSSAEPSRSRLTTTICRNWRRSARKMLPARPVAWIRTSGRTGEFPCKWAPVPKAFYDSMGRYFLGTQILSGARYRGDVNIAEGDVYLYTAAPPPFLTGTVLRAGRDEFPFHFVPSIEDAETMEFQERMEKAFQMAMETGIDYFLGHGIGARCYGRSLLQTVGQPERLSWNAQAGRPGAGRESDGEIQTARGAAAAEALLESEGHHGRRHGCANLSKTDRSALGCAHL